MLQNTGKQHQEVDKVVFEPKMLCKCPHCGQKIEASKLDKAAFDRAAYQRQYMREYMRKRRAKQKVGDDQ